MSITIKIDSREQRPLPFTLPTVVGNLETGDYSIQNLENMISIERKEINDLVGSLSTGRARFERELQRSKALDYFALIVEATFDDLVCSRYRSKMTPASVVESLSAFSIRYGLSIWFAENRDYAGRLTQSLLVKYALEIKKRYKAVENIC